MRLLTIEGDIVIVRLILEMSSHRSASSDETKSQHVDGADKENIERKPELAADPEVTVAPSPSAQEQQWVTGFKLFNIITAVALAIPRITSEFHSLVDVGWYGSAYQLSRCVSMFKLGLTMFD
ncbi:hypothetical protein APSETT445_009308 [Aspergillus pseudonomiae]